MDIIVFGTGAVYQRYKKRIENNNIVAFIDNNTQGRQEFEGKPLYLPEMIKKLSYDRIMIMALAYREMEEQLIATGVTKEKIEVISDESDYILPRIALFCPHVATDNLGDMIIYEAIKEAFGNIFCKYFIQELPTHLQIVTDRHMFKRYKYKYICGSNILNGAINENNTFCQNWKINLEMAEDIGESVLIGAGWANYQEHNSIYARQIFDNLLSKNIMHSVRDDYTKQKLQEFGVKNVLVTGCPTLWKIDEAHCRKIPKRKSDKVVFTTSRTNNFNHYTEKLLEILKRNYSKIYYWPQSMHDMEDIQEFTERYNIQIIAPTLEAYNSILKEDIDYIGMRLHGGIRALQKMKRSIIIEIDNRATEMSKSFNLPTIHLEKLSELEAMINSEIETKIIHNKKEIEAFMGQFM